MLLFQAPSFFFVTMGCKKIPCTCVPTCKSDVACRQRQKHRKAKRKQQALADQAFALVVVLVLLRVWLLFVVLLLLFVVLLLLLVTAAGGGALHRMCASHARIWVGGGRIATHCASGEYNDNLADMSDGASSLSSFASITTGSSSGSGSDSDSDNEYVK